MREKLIELIGETYVPMMRGDAEVGRYTVLPCEATAIADHLIANGVTVQQWIPVTERLPEKQREYLCFCNIDGNTEYPFYMILRYYLVDEKPHFQHECEHGLRVTHWMPLVEPPKGE